MKLISDLNRLSIINPTLCKEWNYVKNQELIPYNVGFGSQKKVWWTCLKCGNEWKESVVKRHQGYGKCLKCRCLEIINPELSKEWHPDKNGPLTPYDVLPNSCKKVWWKGNQCGHEWEATIAHRNASGHGCPYCSGNKVNKDNCLSALNPYLSREWNFNKNKDLTPECVTINSHKNVWWKCLVCGSEWKAIIQARNSGEKKCKFCNSLSSNSPLLLKEWDYEKNKNIFPSSIACQSSIEVWWICQEGHEWKCSIASRFNGSNCPYCSGNKVNKDNCLAIKNPALSNEWHLTKNLPSTPYDFTFCSGFRAWWKCVKCSHEWCAPISNRHNGSGCPYCKGIILKDGEHCDSFVEAYWYLIFKRYNLIFKHNKKYGKLGKRCGCRYDFYFPDNNLYVEITGYDRWFYKWSIYSSKINEKREYVENILCGKFLFIQSVLSTEEKKYVLRNIA